MDAIAKKRGGHSDSTGVGGELFFLLVILVFFSSNTLCERTCTFANVIVISPRSLSLGHVLVFVC